MADEGRVTVTVKGDGGAPWIVYRGNTNEEVLALMNEQSAANVGLLAAQASNELGAYYRNERGGLTAASVQVEQQPVATQQGFAQAATAPPPSFVPQQVQQPPTQQAAQPPAPVCQHGPMTFRQGNGAKGPWKAYFCPTPKGTVGQCQPQFIH